MPKGRALGRGLEALIPVPARGASDEVRQVPVSALRANPRQPRRHWDDAALAELAASVGRHGVLEPLIARDGPEGLEIVAGERRWRAAMRAGLVEVPVIVRMADDRQALEMALAENLQREDLNAWEQAEAFRALQTQFGWTQEELAGQVGKSRSHVANALRVLSLPERTRKLVQQGLLSLAHVKTLLEAEDPAMVETLADEAAQAGWSVRETARRVHGASRPAPPRAPDDGGGWAADLAAVIARWEAPARVRRARGGRLRLELVLAGEPELGSVLAALALAQTPPAAEEMFLEEHRSPGGDVPRGTSRGEGKA